MNEKRFRIVGIGEILFDVLPPNRKTLGGAPTNFAYVAAQLGDHGIIAARVGADADGETILKDLARKGVDTTHIQKDLEHSTGIVSVTLENGQPTYEIVENVAWDFMQLTDDWRVLAKSCDAVCFGSLAQRSAVSRRAIQEFVESTAPECLRIFDVNLRLDYFSAETLETSFRIADIVKMNHEELPRVVDFFSISGSEDTEKAKKILERFDLKAVCVTRGGRGSLLLTANEVSERAGIEIRIADTIGAGDAFTATLTHGFLRGWDLDEINEKANLVGAFVASRAGAMPDFKDLNLTKFSAESK